MVSRRKIASLVGLVGAIVVGGVLFDSWKKAPVEVEIHYLLGSPPVASELDVVLGEGRAKFETRLVSPDVVHRPRLPSGDHDLSITLVSPGGRRTVHRTIRVARNTVIRIDLSREAP